jgi:hypothetical protein
MTSSGAEGTPAKKSTWLISAAAWAAAFVFLAGDRATCFALGLFLVGIVLPCWLLLAAALARLSEDDEETRLLAVAVTLVLLAPLYMLRKVLPVPPPVGDLSIALLAWLLAWRTRAIGGLGPSVRSLMASQTRVWVTLVLPAVFCLTWLGYGVKSGESMKYFGLFFIDFGNLLSIQNVVRASAALPMSPVVQSGPLGYHWLYFAFPGWASEFLGLAGRSANALVVANLITGSLFYLVLARTCGRVLRKMELAVDPSPGRFAPHLAGLSMFALSTLYAYQTFVGRLNRSWFTLGTRNHLVLQLPHSVTCFGNNTLALVLSLLVIERLVSWTSTGARRNVGIAAALASLMPGYSIMLVFPLGLAIVIWAVSGRLRRPIFTLAMFATAAAIALVVFRAIGLFSYGGGGGRVMASFDGGQFLQNVLLGFFPATLAVGICLWNIRSRARLAILFPFVCLALACVIVPTVSMTRGSPTSRVDFSIKTGSLYLVAMTPVFAVALASIIPRWRQRLRLSLIGTIFLAAGLTNSGAYVMQHALRRSLGRDSAAPSISWDHYRALDLVARESSRLILLDQFSISNSVADPAVMLGGKRVLVATGYEEVAFPPSAMARKNKALWLGWQSSGFGDEELGLRLAQNADLLIAAASVRSASWRLVTVFGDVAVYRSIPRAGRAGDVAS